MQSKRTKKHYRRKQKTMVRIKTISALLIALALVTTLSIFIIHGFAQSVSTGDKLPTDSSAATSEVATTTTIPTVPAISINGKIESPRIVLYDETHSSILYSRAALDRCYPASLTKLMTASVLAENSTADETFTVGTELSLVDPESSKAGLKAGYQLTRDQVLDALLLPSGNDTAYTIAAHVGRKVSNNPSLTDIEAVRAFVDLMNQTAQKIGATNTHFVNPDGIHSNDHYTCANDMLLIAENARKFDCLKTSMAKYSVKYNILSGQSVAWTNSNEVINPNSAYYFNGANGMKTGFTDQAGHNLVVSAQRNGVQLIAVIMGGPNKESDWKDADDLLKEAFSSESALSLKTTTTIANP